MKPTKVIALQNGISLYEMRDAYNICKDRFIVNMVRQLDEEHYIPCSEAEAKYELMQYFCEHAENWKFYLIQHARKRVGFLLLQEHGGTIVVSKLFLLSNYRQHGYGMIVMTYLKTICSTIRLTCITRNLAFYAKLGFNSVQRLFNNEPNEVHTCEWIKK